MTFSNKSSVITKDNAMTSASRLTLHSYISLVFLLVWGIAFISPHAIAQGIRSGSMSSAKTLSVPEDSLNSDFLNPPSSARLRCYWWWLNGNVTIESIDHDLAEMKEKGYGGALLVDANGANSQGNDPVPAGPTFGSPAWTALYLHALETAHKLGLEITLTITSGWNLGAPFIQPKNAVKILTWSRTLAAKEATVLPIPPRKEFYQRIAVLAYPLRHGTKLAGTDGDSRAPLADLAQKAAATETGGSMPPSAHLLFSTAGEPNDEDTDLAEVRNVTKDVDAKGVLHWTPPTPGDWEVMTVGYTNSGVKLSPGSGAWQGLSLDHLSTVALDLYWDRAVTPLLRVSKPYLGNTLKYITTDSWEMGGMNWTENFYAEFVKRRGYDPLPYLPIVSGRIVTSRAVSDRFLADLRRTVADLITAYFDHMAVRASEYHLGLQCESGGPHGEPIDALETFRHAAIPQTEFWAMSSTHRSKFADRYFVKEAASAAHIYGKPLVAGEGETSIGNNWTESIGLNLKPTFDMALTEGLNRLVWHQFASSPAAMGLPGQEYFAGTYLNTKVTWWQEAGAFTAYLNRGQFMMQQGLPVADVLYYYGDQVPNFVRLKSDDPATILPGYDYDVTDTDALLHHIIADKHGLRTAEGIRYRMLVLPSSRVIPFSVLEFVERYLSAGGIVVGERPLRSQGIVSTAEQLRYQKLTDLIWSGCSSPSPDSGVHVGAGTLFCKSTARDVLAALHVLPDFDATSAAIDYIHRRTSSADIYFIRNGEPTSVSSTLTFRVAKRQPEMFDPVTGEVTPAMLYNTTEDGRTKMSISLAPYETSFIVFRRPATMHAADLRRDNQRIGLSDTTTVTEQGGQLKLRTSQPGAYLVDLSGGGEVKLVVPEIAPLSLAKGWTLDFPPNWGAPEHVDVPTLKSWTDFSEPGIRYFSGTATYRTSISIDANQLVPGRELWLNLGDVREVARIRVNGTALTPLWKQPYSDRIDTLLHPGENKVEVEVTNLWPNRLIGDAQPGTEHHYTSTNIKVFTQSSSLLTSGMLGPVKLEPIYVLTIPTLNKE
jgi:hypothetical protein